MQCLHVNSNAPIEISHIKDTSINSTTNDANSGLDSLMDSNPGSFKLSSRSSSTLATDWGDYFYKEVNLVDFL